MSSPTAQEQNQWHFEVWRTKYHNLSLFIWRGNKIWATHALQTQKPRLWNQAYLVPPSDEFCCPVPQSSLHISAECMVNNGRQDNQYSERRESWDTVVKSKNFPGMSTREMSSWENPPRKETMICYSLLKPGPKSWKQCWNNKKWKWNTCSCINVKSHYDLRIYNQPLSFQEKDMFVTLDAVATLPSKLPILAGDVPNKGLKSKHDKQIEKPMDSSTRSVQAGLGAIVWNWYAEHGWTWSILPF